MMCGKAEFLFNTADQALHSPKKNFARRKYCLRECRPFKPPLITSVTPLTSSLSARSFNSWVSQNQQEASTAREGSVATSLELGSSVRFLPMSLPYAA